MPFGQVIVGPPGSGKSTLASGLQQFFAAIKRPCAVINLDPANEHFGYDCAIDIRDLVSVADVMEMENLGPNGAMVFSMELLCKNVDWLIEQLDALDVSYYVFDLPGQAELYTHYDYVEKIVAALTEHGIRLASVHLVDAHHCIDHGKFISAVLLSLTVMMRLQLPAVNVLSKMDLLQQYGTLDFGLEMYTDVLDLPRLVGTLRDRYRNLLEQDMGSDVGDEGDVSPLAADTDSRMATAVSTQANAGASSSTAVSGASDGHTALGSKGVPRVDVPSVDVPGATSESQGTTDAGEQGGGGREGGGVWKKSTHKRYRYFAERFVALNDVLAEVVEDFNMVSFCPLNVADRRAMTLLMKTIDSANGYMYGGVEGLQSDLLQSVANTDFDRTDVIRVMEEEYLDALQKADPDALRPGL